MADYFAGAQSKLRSWLCMHTYYEFAEIEFYKHYIKDPSKVLQ